MDMQVIILADEGHAEGGHAEGGHAEGGHALAWRGRRYPCQIGRGGIRADKREGDGGTPVGCFPLRRVYYRPDRLPAPATGLPVTAMAPDDGWCDDPAHPGYNRPVRLPFAASHEVMWREDAVYDVVVVLGHNDDPPRPGLGSAVFLHVARPDGGPTAGCVALPLPDLLTILADATPDDRLCVPAPPPHTAPPPASSHHPGSDKAATAAAAASTAGRSEDSQGRGCARPAPEGTEQAERSDYAR